MTITSDLLLGTLLLSVLHGVIPGHWLPVLALKKQFGWSAGLTLRVAALAASAHACSTVALGLVLAWAGDWAAERMALFTHWVMPLGLVGLGVYFMYQHHTHHHFHLTHASDVAHASPRKVVGLLTLMMFLSPCLEIEAIFVMAGAQGWATVAWVGTVYALLSVLGITLWVALAQSGLQRLNWHRIEHNAGLISGGVLVVTGLLSFFAH
ncbi:MAG TPA: hypothetical protein PK971_08025 [Saprospiraceae bacterium]|nr:hypothetical protein [Saprospiraceae bacterium]HND88260.1 hypothetical protein [Saprospiraceae bacterium]